MKFEFSICQPQTAFFPLIKLSIMEILMDFNKPSISKKIKKFLLDNLKTEKEKESLISVTSGKRILKGDAITLSVLEINMR